MNNRTILRTIIFNLAYLGAAISFSYYFFEKIDRANVAMIFLIFSISFLTVNGLILLYETRVTLAIDNATKSNKMIAQNNVEHESQQQSIRLKLKNEKDKLNNDYRSKLLEMLLKENVKPDNKFEVAIILDKILS